MCHYCGFSMAAPARCPACGGPLKAIGTGTQKVQQELAALFPDMETSRMDADTVSAVNTHEKILEHFQKENVPVLLGTQMVAKGLNLPNVTLVGVLDRRPKPLFRRLPGQGRPPSICLPRWWVGQDGATAPVGR